MLPKDYPLWETVYNHYWRWSQRGVWEAVLDEINEIHRKKNGKEPAPTFGIIDSQSVKTASSSDFPWFWRGQENQGQEMPYCG